MVSGSIAGLFATTKGGVPKPRVEFLEVTKLGIRNEVIRDTKHHGGSEKAVVSSVLKRSSICNLLAIQSRGVQQARIFS